MIIFALYTLHDTAKSFEWNAWEIVALILNVAEALCPDIISRPTAIQDS